MNDFRFRMFTDVKYGVGISKTAATICREQGKSKAMLLIDKFLLETEAAKQILEGFKRESVEYVLFTDIVPEPPAKYIDAVADIMRSTNCDICVAVGGGSTIDTAKAIAMLQNNEGKIADYLFGGTRAVEYPSVPVICIPSTAGTGAETTAAAVIEDTEKGKKLSVTNDKLIPPFALLDPMLMDSIPAHVAAATGMDALTHAIESYTSRNSNLVGDAYGLYAMKLIAENLRECVNNPTNMEARGKMLIASFLGGAAILNCGVAVVHGIAQSIGAVAHVSHGLGNALILPYSMKKCYMGNPEKFKDIAIILGEDVEGLTVNEAAAKAADAIIKLERDIGICQRLSEVGVTREMFPQIIEETMKYRLRTNTPVEVNEDYIREILEEAF